MHHVMFFPRTFLILLLFWILVILLVPECQHFCWSSPFNPLWHLSLSDHLTQRASAYSEQWERSNPAPSPRPVPRAQIPPPLILSSSHSSYTDHLLPDPSSSHPCLLLDSTPTLLSTFCELRFLITHHSAHLPHCYQQLLPSHLPIWSYRFWRTSPLSPESSPLLHPLASSPRSTWPSASGSRDFKISLPSARTLLYSCPHIYLIHSSKFCFTSGQMLTKRSAL